MLGMSPSLRFSLNPDSNSTCSYGRIDEGTVMRSDGVGLIIESRSARYPVGDLLSNISKTMDWPWRQMLTLDECEIFGRVVSESDELVKRNPEHR